MNQKQLLEAMEIINAVGCTWKVKRALLKHKVGLCEETIKALVPEPLPHEDY